MIIKNYEESRHLSSRLGIGVNHEIIQSHIGMDIQKILEGLTHCSNRETEEFKISSSHTLKEFRSLTKKKKQEARKARKKEGRKLAYWWLKKIHLTEYPLHERMTLFWHNHFTSSLQKIKWPQLMYQQHQLLRSKSIGNFADMLYAISKDPAMLIYLDGGKNLSKSPNENFARELLELFTLGEGHYTEKDVIEVARAFTGWRYSFSKTKTVFVDRNHDQGKKRILGHVGNFDANDVIKILLDHPRTAELIAEKFWNHFINPFKPDQTIIKMWADNFRKNNYDIKTLLHDVITSKAFWKEENRASLIKSPVELTIGVLRDTQIQFRKYGQIHALNKQLGQELLAPPDVKGWRGGQHWINASTLGLRTDFLLKIVDRLIIQKQEKKENKLFSLSQSELTKLLLPAPPVSILRKNIKKEQMIEQHIKTIISDPTYQLR